MSITVWRMSVAPPMAGLGPNNCAIAGGAIINVTAAADTRRQRELMEVRIKEKQEI
jgi:hypothetical protein